ncbi:glycosyltransferase 52 family protein [Vibrio splendidus]|uniref:Glycosyltransferase 52 family protein n=1 Tax=Vibrio splendidus TaxID=29497 RepID=A0ABV4LQJ6_VIBSP|nr:glycosyltransferase 52 family protein [Vibrio splendidus]PMH12037.1 glycosyltransferase 52 family protein [Vibrio splendidus]PMI31423.1 glycosyltransferase 52 family protein [Vibrio splendidus]PMM36100.1 glycosyltransferase 52 family protein [Vibrio splendidus]PMO73970.1 glycosyltransferase 52 family protein [Vibrio splendidus]PTP66456.1 glycosyltransferase 52 family protein [Vibrio splendidus]
MNLFLVTSPLQYICAVEAREHLRCKNNILVLMNQNGTHGLTQQRKIVNLKDWDHVIEIERGNRSFVFPKVIKEVTKFLNTKRLSHFFYAEYNAWWTKLLIRNLPIDKEIYFDDGTLTLLEYQKFILTENEFYRPRLIQDFVVRCNGSKPIGRLAQSENLEIFTMFDLKPSKFTVHKNSLKSLKGKYGHPTLYDANAPIGFIGQGAIGDKNQKTIDEYLSEILKISHNAQRDILYFPHRTEKKPVRDTLIKSGKVKYHCSEYPLEIELIDKKIKLSSLIGTFSTVMFSCRLLYPEMPIYSISSSNPDKSFERELKQQMLSNNIKEFIAK